MHVNIFGLRIGLFTHKQLQALGAAGLSVVEQAVAGAQDTPLGTKIEDLIVTVKNDALTGDEKRAKVLKLAEADIMDYALKGGFAGAEADVTDFGLHLVQAIYNKVVSVKAASVASAILKYIASLIK